MLSTESQGLLNGPIGQKKKKIIFVKIRKSEQFCTNVHFHYYFASLHYVATFC